MIDARRVLLVGPLPPPAGGMANQTRQLKQLLEAEGIAVVLVQTNAAYRPAWVGRVRGVRAVFRLLPYLWRLLTSTRRGSVAHVMANSGWAWDLFAAPAIKIAKWKGVRTIVNYRGGLAAEFLERAHARVCATLAGTTLVVPTEFLRGVFRRYGVGATVIPNIVDVELFRPRPGPSEQRAPTPHIVITRNLERIYGIDLGLQALAILKQQYPTLRASIAGTGPEASALLALTQQLGLERFVTFTGRLDPPAIAQLYQEADLLLNPVRADNSPNSVLEALACGVPVVSTKVGGIPFLLEHERTAILVDPESPAALAAGMDRLLRDSGLRRRLGEQGLQFARSLSWPVVRPLWLEAYGFAG